MPLVWKSGSALRFWGTTRPTFCPFSPQSHVLVTSQFSYIILLDFTFYLYWYQEFIAFGWFVILVCLEFLNWNVCGTHTLPPYSKDNCIMDLIKSVFVFPLLCLCTYCSWWSQVMDYNYFYFIVQFLFVFLGAKHCSNFALARGIRDTFPHAFQ